MNQVIIITGAYSGIGKATAELFSQKQWKVFSFLQREGKNDQANIQNVVVDMTSQDSIQKAIGSVYQNTGRIDNIVNNAGFGALGTFETSSHSERHNMFQVNVFGLLKMIQETLPFFRKQSEDY